MKRWLALIALILTANASAGDNLFLTASKKVAYDAAVEDLQNAIMNYGYFPFRSQAISDGLHQKGYAHHGEYKLIFIGKAEETQDAVKIDPSIGLVLPLKIIIYREGDRVSAYAPSMQIWKEMYPNPALARFFDKWQRDLQDILNDYAAQ